MASKKSKILIVEDDKFLVKAYEIKFSHDGYNVIVAGDGATGLEMAAAEMPSAIVLDLMLPKLDGFKFLESMHNNEKLKDIPIIVLSNLGQKSDKEKALGLGAKGYFVKTDYSLEDIINKIKEYTTQQ